MKKLVLLLCALSLSWIIYSQSETDSLDRDQLEVTGSFDQPVENTSQEDMKKWDTDLTLGTSFTVSPGNFYGPSLFLAPSLLYRFNPRFTLSTGIALEHATFYPLYNYSSTEDQLLPMTRAFIYARGSYRISDRLIVGGTAYKAINDVPRLTSYSSPYNFNYEGMSFDIHYKISDGFAVGFQMHLQNGNYYQDGLIPPAGYVPLNGF